MSSMITDYSKLPSFDVLNYDGFDYKRFEHENFDYENFERENFDYESWERGETYALLFDQIGDYNLIISILQNPKKLEDALKKDLTISSDSLFQTAVCSLMGEELKDIEEEVKSMTIQKISEIAEGVFGEMDKIIELELK